MGFAMIFPSHNVKEWGLWCEGRGQSSIFISLLDWHKTARGDDVTASTSLMDQFPLGFDLFVPERRCQVLISWEIFSIPGNEVPRCGGWKFLTARHPGALISPDRQ